MDYVFLNEEDTLHFIPLGGSEQFGVNLNVYAHQGELLAVDCGIGFADERLPGVDIVLPDPEFLEENADDLKGMIITHAHEDHVGGVAYLWERLQCPLYASPFTAAILRKKLEEMNLRGAKIHVVEPLDEVQIGSFAVQFLPVAHSIPDSCALFIKTASGNVVHSGDWNLDPHPVLGSVTDPKLFQSIGEQGVMAYIGDSTNAMSPGYSGSETDVEQGLEQLFRECNGRIVVTAFASNVGRVRSITKAAQACGRDVGLIGRSLHRMVGTARELGYMDDMPEYLGEEDIGFVPEDKAVLIVTGSQGEARAALARIARGDHKAISLSRGDTVVFSARAIPGNEKDINHVCNNLSAAGIHVVTPSNCNHKIHVSGHPCQEEIAQMLQWVKPQAVIPVHGERTQLDAQASFVKGLQIGSVVVPNNGSVIRLGQGDAPEIIEHVESGVLAVDQKRIVKATHRSFSARRKLQYSGAIHVSLVVDAKGKMLSDPKLDTVGLIDDNEPGEEKIEDSIYDEVLDIYDDMSWEDRMDDHFMAEEIRIGLRRLCNYVLGFKPKTTVHVVRI